MTPEQWKRMKEIYKSLFGLPKGEWEALLPKSCEGDEELQGYVKCLLNMPPGFLEREAPRPNGCTDISLSPGEVLAGRWQIVELLGKGGMAVVYAADDPELNERVALKVIRSDSNLFDRFKREVELARKVRQRNVCAVYDIGRDHQGSRDLIFFTMALIPGETMEERLRHAGHLDPSEWLPVAEQLCKALQEAHRVKVLHRDLKPGNVMLVGSGKDIRAIVTDFGIARAIGGEQDSRLGLTARSIIMGTWCNASGTLPYMSPEQKRVEELAETSDIYSLGLVLYEMITGKQYYKFPKLKNIPKHKGNWRKTIQRCLEDDPAKRFRSATEVLEAIKPVPPPPFIWRLLRITAMMAIFASLAVPIAKPIIKRVYPPPPSLPSRLRIAIIPFKTSADSNIQALADGWVQTIIQKLNRLQNPHIKAVPWDDVQKVKPEDALAAASKFGFNVYVVCTMTKQQNQISFNIQLEQVNPQQHLRSDKFHFRADEGTISSDLFQKITRLVSASSGSDEPLSRNQKARRFYDIAIGYLANRDLPNIEDAISQFQKAVEEDPQFAQAYAYLAFAYSIVFRKTHDPGAQGNALLAHEHARKLDGNLPMAHLAFGSILQDTGKLADAIKEFENALSLDPTDREIRSMLSMAYLEADKVEDAKRMLKQAIEQDDSDWFNHNDLAYTYYRNGELADAEKEFHKAVELAPGNSIANSSLAGICICFGKYDQAEEILKHTLASKKSAMADANLARVNEQHGHYAYAITLLKDATQLRPKIDEYWLALGEAHNLHHDQVAATESFRKALELAKDDLKSRSQDGDLLARIALYDAKLGERDAALQELSQAERIGSAQGHPSAELLINSARVYELLGNRKAALKILGSVLRNRCARSEAEITPDFASLRSDRRYKELVKQISL